MRSNVVSPAPVGNTKRFGYWLPVLMALLAVNLIARLPLCWDPANVDNDGAEYLAIARHLRTTGQYATDLKWQFYTNDPVQHSAWADRPPAYPVFAVICQRALPFLDPTAAARVGNALLACVALVLVALFLRRLYGEEVALLAAGYTFLLPHTLFWTTQPTTETLTLALTYAGLLLWPYTESAPAAARFPSIGVRMFLAGVFGGLAYLARPTGILLIGALAFAGWWQMRRASLGRLERNRLSGRDTPHKALQYQADQPQTPNTAPRVASGTTTDTLLRTWRLTGGIGWLLVGFLLFAAPFHLLLWHTYGSPTHSALGFTFAVATYYEVSYYGFEAARPGVAGFLASHGLEIPGLIFQQIGRHAQALLSQLAGLLPLALWMRARDWTGECLAAGIFTVLVLAAHTITWAAWGSSRYFIVCLPILVASLLAVRTDTAPALFPSLQAWGPRLRRLCIAGSAFGLALSLVYFYRQQMRPDRGLSSLPAWKIAAADVRGARMIACDKPAILNLLLETPAVRLPLTTDTAKMARFVGAYRPDVLVLFPDEPKKRPMAAAWRRGDLPPGWRLVVDERNLLIARPGAGTVFPAPPPE